MAELQAVTDETFETEVIQSQVPVFIDLWAPWCGPCRSLAPIVEQLSQQYAGRVKFVKANVDENPAIAQAFRVQSIPLMAMLKNDTVVGTILGLRPQDQLSQWIEAALTQIEAGLPQATDTQA